MRCNVVLLLLVLPSTAIAQNVIVQLANFAKDSVVRTATSFKELYTSHQQCNEIRQRQKSYRTKCIEQWESEGAAGSRKELLKKSRSLQGGITFEDYVFLQKGKEDRGKLLNILFLMFGAPRFFPYAVWFNPDLLPSPFKSDNGKDTTTETTAQRFTRERTGILLNTLGNLERQARTVKGGGFMSMLNPFGGGKKVSSQQSRLMVVYDQTKSLLAESLSSSSSLAVLKPFQSAIYQSAAPTRAEQRLVHVPACVVKGLNEAVSGKTGGVLSGLMPHVLVRGAFVNHLSKVTDADNFLVQTRVQLESISHELLQQACQDRMLSGSNDAELRERLQEWLSATQPAGEHYNGNVARLILMAYHGCSQIRNNQVEPTLQHLLLTPKVKEPELVVTGRKQKSKK